MKIRVLSDLHTEFHADGGAAFISSLPLDPAPDIVALAGDIGNRHTLVPTLERICARFVCVPILFVPGNHEFYRYPRESLTTLISMVRAPNFWPIANKDFTIGLQCYKKFIGATLFFPDNPFNQLFEAQCADWTEIPEYRHWVYAQNTADVNFLRTEMTTESIVVTHHLPSYLSIGPQFHGSQLNRYFLSDMTEDILQHQPTLWIHGHTHISLDYHIGKTRVVCNPFGYAGSEENRSFDPAFTIEI